MVVVRADQDVPPLECRGRLVMLVHNAVDDKTQREGSGGGGYRESRRGLDGGGDGAVLIVGTCKNTDLGSRRGTTSVRV